MFKQTNLIALIVVLIASTRLLLTAIEHDAWRSFAVSFIHLVVTAAVVCWLLRENEESGLEQKQR